jgi:hypothetical protein
MVPFIFARDTLILFVRFSGELLLIAVTASARKVTVLSTSFLVILGSV